MQIIIALGGGDVNRPRLDGITPVLIAAERNVNVDLMMLLLDSGGELGRLRQVREVYVRIVNARTDASITPSISRMAFLH
jgi:hypothetical protein